MMELVKDFEEYFEDKRIIKIVIIGTSGIVPAVMLGYLLQAPAVHFKKDTSRIMRDGLYTCQICSFTKSKDYDIVYNGKYSSAGDHVLFLDDFMAGGETCLGGIGILKQANAVIEGIGIVIKKALQQGHLKVEARGYSVYSQACIASLSQEMTTSISEEYKATQVNITYNPDTIRFLSCPWYAPRPHTQWLRDYIFLLKLRTLLLHRTLVYFVTGMP